VFVDGATDGDVNIGYFNAKERQAIFVGGNRDYPPNLARQLGGRRNIHLGFDQRGVGIGGILGFHIGGPTSIGYYFSAVCKPTEPTGLMQNGPVIHPDRRRRSFSFDYDPKANDGVGKVVARLDDQTFYIDLTPEMRETDATFTHFGISSVRVGGKWVTVYLDDLTYTARRANDATPVHHEQETTIVPYPPGGRKF
jgi:hypothetical protein